MLDLWGIHVVRLPTALVDDRARLNFFSPSPTA